MAVVREVWRNAGEVRALAALAGARIVLTAAYRERESAAPRHDRREVPTADEEIRQAVLEFHRQGPYAGEIEDVLEVVIRGPAVIVLVVGVRHVGAVALVGRTHVVVDGFGEGVVG